MRPRRRRQDWWLVAGYVVAIGLVDPANLKRNAGAKPGDVLLKVKSSVPRSCS